MGTLFGCFRQLPRYAHFLKEFENLPEKKRACPGALNILHSAISLSRTYPPIGAERRSSYRNKVRARFVTRSILRSKMQPIALRESLLARTAEDGRARLV